jgi:hypothetical protein
MRISDVAVRGKRDYPVSGWAENLFGTMKRDRATFLLSASGSGSVRIMRQSLAQGAISWLTFWEMPQKVMLLHHATLFGLSFQFRGFGERFDKKVPGSSECFHKKLCYWFSQRFRFLQWYCNDAGIELLKSDPGRGEGWKLIERNHRFTNVSWHSAKTWRTMRLQFYQERWNLVVESGSQDRSDHRLTPRSEREDTQFFLEIGWLNSQLFQGSSSTYMDASVAYLWEWVVE